MAGDITSTEKKVQSFFDQKKNEMKEELHRSVNGQREEFKLEQQESQMLQKAKEEVAKIELEKEKTKDEPEVVVLEPHKVEVYFDHHEESKEIPVIKEEKDEPKIIVIKDDKHEESILSSEKPLSELSAETNNAGNEEGDYLDKFLKQEESSPAAEKEEKIEVVKEEPKLEQVVEQNSGITPQPFKQTLPPKPPYKPTMMGPHPKTGQGFGVDLQGYFNFGKRAK